MSLKRALNKAKKICEKKPNCFSVGIGLKKTDGKLTDEECIIFFVTKKMPLSCLKSNEVLPKTIGKICTDVQEMAVPSGPRPIGKAKAVNKTDKLRPAPAGCSIGHYKVTAGTQGGYLIKNNEIKGLSNNHVKACENLGQIGDPIYQPGTYDGGNSNDVLERLEAFIPLYYEENSTCPTAQWASLYNTLADLFGRKTRLVSISRTYNKVDGAIGRPINPNDYDMEIIGIGLPTGVDYDPLLGTKGLSSGRTSCLTNKAILTTKNWSGPVQYGRGVAWFDQQYLWEHQEGEIFSRGGDSGKLILDHNKNINSLLYGGSDTHSISNPIGLVEQYLGGKVWYSRS